MLIDKRRNEQATDFKKINNNLKSSSLLFVGGDLYCGYDHKTYGHIKILIIYSNFKTV